MPCCTALRRSKSASDTSFSHSEHHTARPAFLHAGLFHFAAASASGFVESIRNEHSPDSMNANPQIPNIIIQSTFRGSSPSTAL
jgi:hypothetical protein